jgi:poly-gamma-glutamate capsule biosynthesis protein CapA/YwtB (metallophosphatase superfamily)
VAPRRPLALASICVILFVSACSGAPTAQPSPSVPASSTPTSAAPSPTPTTPPEITLAFGGDVHFTERTLKLLDNPATAFGPVAAIFQAADVSMVNLETAVTTRGTPEPKTYHFRAPATAFDAVKAAGLDAVSQANNHSLDYGQVGLADTFSAAKAAGVPVVGAGTNATAAYTPWITTVKGVRIAILAFSQIGELSTTWVATDTRPGIALAYTQQQIDRAAAAVRAATTVADVVVVFMHWGEERNQCPIALQRTAARAFADAGAKIVVGTHAHVMQGDGWLGQTYVAYGMSNFVWYINSQNDTGVIRVTLSGAQVVKTEFLPAYIDRSTGQPIPSTGAEATRISAAHAALRGCTGLVDGPASP